MIAQQQLIRLLADGELHSGSELADELGVSRTAVWKHLGQLESIDLEVSAQAGQGYRLAAPLELLDGGRIATELSHATRAVCSAPEILWTSPSTNSHLLDALPPEPGKATACLAEYQSAGRGRRGRRWFAPAGHGICLSVGWRFVTSPANLSCLGLAVGVGVLRALRAGGVADVGLKWPNDIVLDGRKLAGILIDVQGEAGGPLYVVAGVGVNYRLSERTRTAVRDNGGLEPASVCDDSGGELASRNTLAALLIDALCGVLSNYEQRGFEACSAEWQAADYLYGREISVQTDSGELKGTAMGICPEGRLRVRSGGEEVLLVTGDVSVRVT